MGRSLASVTRTRVTAAHQDEVVAMHAADARAVAVELTMAATLRKRPDPRLAAMRSALDRLRDRFRREATHGSDTGAVRHLSAAVRALAGQPTVTAIASLP